MPVNTYITANGRIRRRITTDEGRITDQVAVVTNALGSVVATYKDGWLTADRSYDPYGETRAEWNDVGRFGWVGGLGYRETRREWVSHYVRARHYGFPMGMWTSVDPLWPSELAFGYVGGSVTEESDPLGLQGKRKPSTSGQPFGAVSFSKGKGNCSESQRAKRLSDIGRLNQGQETRNQFTPANVQSLIAGEPCCQALIRAAIQGSVSAQIHSAAMQALDSKMRKFLEAAIFCIVCRETTFRASLCDGPHRGGSSAQGMFGWLQGPGNYLTSHGSGQSDFGRLGGRGADMRAGIKALCAEMCRRTPGCVGCPIWNSKGVSRTVGYSSAFRRPWPNNVWPYMPGPGGSQGNDDFADCMQSFGFPTTGKNFGLFWR